MFTPLQERSLGMMTGTPPYKQLMDDKLMSNTDYMFDGDKGGKAWQKLLSEYLGSKVPAALDTPRGRSGTTRPWSLTRRLRQS